jgi:hypothetical protein
LDFLSYLGSQAYTSSFIGGCWFLAYGVAGFDCCFE